jgi:diguanylate cyclase (GGDEF)-like protein
METLSAIDRGQVLHDAKVEYWKHLRPIVQLALAIHVMLFVLFLVMDLPLLYAVNALSVLTYVACLLALHLKFFCTATSLMSVEIILHSALTTWVLGWESNFYAYLFCIVPLINFGFQTSPWRRLGLSAIILGGLVAGFSLRHRMGHGGGALVPWLELLGEVNLVGATLMLMNATASSVRHTMLMQYDLYHRAARDSLTNLYTRRRILQAVQQLSAPTQVTLMMLDIDHFKQINDRHGHDYGDQVLQEVAAAISACVRVTDVASRWGGEEFLVLMPATSPSEALVVAERMRTRLKDAARPVSATFALVGLRPEETFRDALERADRVLYQGKEAGRDRIMLGE